MSNKKVIKPPKVEKMLEKINNHIEAMRKIMDENKGVKIGVFSIVGIINEDEKVGGYTFQLEGDQKALSDALTNYLASESGLNLQNLFHFAMLNNTNKAIDAISKNLVKHVHVPDEMEEQLNAKSKGKIVDFK